MGLNFLNLTHSSQIQKLDPDHPLPNLLKSAQAKQTDFEQRLENDSTKTNTERRRLSHESAIGLTKSLMGNVDSLLGPKQRAHADYEDKASGAMKIQGTTDLVILSATYQALKDHPIHQLLQIGESDPNVSRMLLLYPAAKYGYELSDSARAAFQEQVRKHALGDDYPRYSENRAELEAVRTFGEGLRDKHVEFSEGLKTIDKNRVKDLPTVE